MALRTRRGDFLLAKDFFLMVFGGIAEGAILGLYGEGKQEQRVTERLDEWDSSKICAHDWETT
ncbi:MAG: hypothetical protein OEV51_06230 [Nitrospira sp.]|nr:hypothetical protein [Nitrospira sp.]